MSARDEKAVADEGTEAGKLVASVATDDGDCAGQKVVTEMPEGQQEHLEPAAPEGEDSPTPRPPDRVISATDTSTSHDQTAHVDDEPIITNLNTSQDRERSQTIPKTNDGKSAPVARELFPRIQVPDARNVATDPGESEADRAALEQEVLQCRRENEELKRKLALCEKIYHSYKMGPHGHDNF